MGSTAQTPHGAIQTLALAIERAGIPSGARILVAVSGGPDSVALLRALHLLASDPAHGWPLRLGHINHQLRSEESDEDEAFVRSLAEELALTVDVARVDVRRHATSSHLSIEGAARELRYRALATMLHVWRGDLIALGHTQDDQAETVLLRLLRGTGLEGLGGMRVRSDHLIRPFLGLRHETILEALQAQGQGYRVDSTNLDLHHRRNKVRRQLIPAMQTIQPRVVRVLARTASLLQSDADYLRDEARRAVTMLEVIEEEQSVSASLGVWRALHPALKRQALRALAGQILSNVRNLDEAHVGLLCDALEQPGGRSGVIASLPHHISLWVEAERFTLWRNPEPACQPLSGGTLPAPGELEMETGTLSVGILPQSSDQEWRYLTAVSGPLHAFCDADALGGRLSVRSWRPGDRMRPLGMKGSRKLQDMFTDRRVPRRTRHRVPIVENDRFIVWVPGVAQDDRAALTERTRRVAHLCYRPGARE